MLMIRNLNLINVQSWTYYLDKVGRRRFVISWLRGGELEGPGSRVPDRAYFFVP